MKQYKHINTGKPVRLSQLITSGDVTDDDPIAVCNDAGHLLAIGYWHHGGVIAYRSGMGTAEKSGTGRTVIFKLL